MKRLPKFYWVFKVCQVLSALPRTKFTEEEVNCDLFLYSMLASIMYTSSTDSVIFSQMKHFCF